jgi:hypothetical protein
VTSDERKQKNVAAMGHDMGTQFTVLTDEFTTLNWYWKEFVELFATNEKRIARLNHAASSFFHMLQGQQFETNMLHLARLTDSPKSVGKANLTVFSLPNLVTDPGLKAELVVLLDDVKAKAEFCRDWRNRRFAHADLSLAIRDGAAMPLASAPRENFAAALKAVDLVLNKVEGHYFRNHRSFEDVIGNNGAAMLLRVLGLGVRELERNNENAAKGDYEGIEWPERI